MIFRPAREDLCVRSLMASSVFTVSTNGVVTIHRFPAMYNKKTINYKEDSTINILYSEFYLRKLIIRYR